jgi:hypothetical protein
MRDARSDRGGRERRSPATGDRTLIYFHRLHFPSESGQTIQVLRDYHALARAGKRSTSCTAGDNPNRPTR